MNKESVYIIIPVHNRKAITLKCLETLQQNGDLERYYTVVVDDGSTAGTSEAINELYPDIIILSGDGNLWWTGAIRKGMEYVYEQGAEYFIWLNDDTLPNKKCLAYLIDYCKSYKKHISSAQCYENLEVKNSSYRGNLVKGWRHFHTFALTGQLTYCKSLSGNLVCFSRSVIDSIGYPPNHKTPHYYGDVLYTWQARLKGYKLAILGSATALCSFNSDQSSWLIGEISFRENWQKLSSPKSMRYFKGYWHFCLTVWGIFGILIYYASYIKLIGIGILRFIFPLSWLKFFKYKLAKI
ncbi:MAG: glycosyltransferase family 2 protein [Gomphosphaeria aponina SAG 52.96 = DSM 107014]|uniref:Glycosyltransferase family 2 protein n=1 Tax=Gomphosphaeria aponina SAG 52.96 = DSM 107014 TaxID=1521640 RepID=A0A941GML5_9CHRO|nr:glycosyltransferase family 2 protein [Gomphosphaeria aponina SAG 52.96 = DSM 107014]